MTARSETTLVTTGALAAHATLARPDERVDMYDALKAHRDEEEPIGVAHKRDNLSIKAHMATAVSDLSDAEGTDWGVPHTWHVVTATMAPTDALTATPAFEQALRKGTLNKILVALDAMEGVLGQPDMAVEVDRLHKAINAADATLADRRVGEPLMYILEAVADSFFGGAWLRIKPEHLRVMRDVCKRARDRKELRPAHAEELVLEMEKAGIDTFPMLSEEEDEG